ncbi:hypothetical protein LTR41_010427 [Exophiala xenobiotica]|nr:hypothetical protein LTR41_010427 [Exophiala xenobiotica]
MEAFSDHKSHGLSKSPHLLTDGGEDDVAGEVLQERATIAINRSSVSTYDLFNRGLLIMIMSFILFYAVYYLTAVTAITATVDLSYATYEGLAHSNGITAWLGMRYAAAPVGDLRFAAPQDPPAIDGVQKADKHGKICLGTGQSLHNGGMSEDCLFVDVFAPTHATSESKLPVYFFIQGGGFNFDSNANYDGSGLIASSDYNIVVVTFNYRVGPYGFIAGRETDSLNNGIKDQRKALQWVQRHISRFGGDPSHVVLGGDSAGAASIALHLTAYGGRNDGLFVGAAAESVSFATTLTVEESQYQYDDLAVRLGCLNRSSSTSEAKCASTTEGHDTLACLRSKTTAELQSENVNTPYPVFTPRSTSSLAQSNTFLHDQFPYLTLQHLKRIKRLFPNHGPDFPNSGSWWRQVSNTYGDMRYMCPTLFISSAFARYGAKGKGNWNYRYNVEDAAQMKSGMGVPHTVELGAIWGPENVGGSAPSSYHAGGSNHWIVPLMQGYWTSFIRALDPNVHRLEGAPMWEEFVAASRAGGAGKDVGSRSGSENDDDDRDTVKDKGEERWQRMLFGSKNTTGMEIVSTSVRARCRYLSSIGVAIRQ